MWQHKLLDNRGQNTKLSLPAPGLHHPHPQQKPWGKIINRRMGDKEAESISSDPQQLGRDGNRKLEVMRYRRRVRKKVLDDWWQFRAGFSSPLSMRWSHQPLKCSQFTDMHHSHLRSNKKQEENGSLNPFFPFNHSSFILHRFIWFYSSL